MHASPPPQAAGLTLTGERTLPGIPDENYWFRRHLVAYEAVRQLADQRVVLDAGCGEGYGLSVLANAGATRVIGADLDRSATDHARETYGNDVIEVHHCELMSLPLADDTVDLTISLQVIEHLHDIPGYLASLVRVTRPGGTIVIGTPNRLTFTPDSDTPQNPFHTIEFTARELDAVLRTAGLVVTETVGVHHGILLAAVEHDARKSLPDLQLSTEPGSWPSWLRQLVHRTSTNHFEVRANDLDKSLDLIATCTVPA